MDASRWARVDAGDDAARRGHAERIAGIAELLDEVQPAQLACWVSARYQESMETARAWVREARDLCERPDLLAACLAGQLSGDQAAALRTLSTPDDEGAWVEVVVNDGLFGDWPIAELRRQADKARAARRSAVDGGVYLGFRPRRDGFTKLSGVLPGEDAAAFENLLASKVLASTPWRDMDAAYAQALRGLLPSDATWSSGRPMVLVASSQAVVDATSDEPGLLQNGSYIPAQAVRELVASGARVVDVDVPPRRCDTDDIPDVTRLLVGFRDGFACRICDDTEHTEVDHIVDRALGGSHDPSNLFTACFEHHQRWKHGLGGRIVGDANGELAFLNRDGKPYIPPHVHRARPPNPN